MGKMEQHKNVPAIRFKGFQEEWTEKNITELSKVFIGLVTTMTKFYTNSGTLLIRNSDIKNNYFEFAENPIYLEQKFADQNSSRKLLIGDVVTVHTGDVGTSAVISENEFGAIGFATINTRVNQKIILPNYLSTFLNSSKHKKFAIQNSTGDGRSNYNLKDFLKLNIPLTSIEEQTQIGNFFKNIDEQINLQEQKHQKLVNLKKAMLEKMFPKEGADVPEIRFKGFTEKWEEKKLGEVVKIINGFAFQSKNFALSNTNIIVLTPGNVKICGGFQSDKGHYYNSYSQYLSKFTFRPNDIFITLTDLTPTAQSLGYPAYIPNDDKVYLHNQRLGKLVDLKIDKSFMFQFLCTSLYHDKVVSTSSGTTVKHSSSDKIHSIRILVPILEEQQKIGNYFEQLDTLIQQSQVKIDKYKNIKQALLQKMFV